MTEADIPSLVPGEWLMNKHLKFVRFLKHDGTPGNHTACGHASHGTLIWCSEVFTHIPEECVDTGDAVLYSVRTLSKIEENK